MTAPTKQKAIDRLQPSHLKQTQLELMGEDVDLSKLYLALGHNNINIHDAILDVQVERTIQGASTITVPIKDRDWKLVNSGRLSSKNDIEIDGLFFRLTGVRITGSSQLELDFEDREVSVLRTYNRPIKQSQSTSRITVTRAQFVYRLLREVKEIKFLLGKNVFIPELNVVQPIGSLAQKPDAPSASANRSFGIPGRNTLTVKGSSMSESQRQVANAVLDAGVTVLAPLNSKLLHAMLVMGIMACIQESTLANLPLNPSTGSSGVLQQRAASGWPASGDPATDAAEFFTRLRKVVIANPGRQYWADIQDVQHSAFPTYYAQWRTESERIVNDYGTIDLTAKQMNRQWDTTSGSSSGDYEFYRGIPPTSTLRKQKYGGKWGKESTWDCLTRLAAEVQWRSFFVSGSYYFIDDDDLLKSQPVAVIDRDTPGVIAMSDADYSENTKTATVTMTVECARWAAPPGSVIVLQKMGPWDGRWIVNDFRRSLFQKQAIIVLKKRWPRLPEPASGNVIGTQTGGTWKPTDWGGSPVPDNNPSQFRAVGLVQPVPKGYNPSIVQGEHPTAGLPGYPAVDYGGNAGAPVVAVENGTIIRWSGQDPALGPWDPHLGAHGPFGWSIYLKGDSGSVYYYTHLGSRSHGVKETVRSGETIGSIGDYAQWGGTNHVHLGTAPAASGHPDWQDILSSPIPTLK